MSSLAPECLLYLFYQDAFSLLHKYMYLPRATVCDGKVKLLGSDAETFKHDGKRYCPWCDDPTLPNNVREGCEFFTGETLQVLDDRLYDYVETFDFDEYPLQPKHGARSYLSFCVKVSDTVKALTDPVLELKRSETADEAQATVDPPAHAVEYVPKTVVTKSALCSTLRRLLLPADGVDSKTWLLPLVLAAANNLESLGDCLLQEGVRLARDLGLEQSLSALNNICELAVALEDFTWTRTRDKFSRRMKCLQAKHAHWSIFTGQAAAAMGALSLKHFLEKELEVVLESADLKSIKTKWKEDINVIPVDFPSLRSLKISVQSSVLCANDRESMWATLTDLNELRELHVHSSSWIDTMALLESVGRRLESLSLTNISSSHLISPGDASGRVYLNNVGALCPGLERVYLGELKDNAPHAIYANSRLDTGGDSLANLVYFEAIGNITLEALQYLWQHARKLEVLKVSGSIVSSGEGNSEVVLTKDRVEYLFTLNPMTKLRELNVDMTIASIVAAHTLLDGLPREMKSLSTMNVKVSIPESLEGQSFGDLVSVILARMASFKSECLARKGEIDWNWRREGILTILLQQQMLLSFSDLIDP